MPGNDDGSTEMKGIKEKDETVEKVSGNCPFISVSVKSRTTFLAFSEEIQ